MMALSIRTKQDQLGHTFYSIACCSNQAGKMQTRFDPPHWKCPQHSSGLGLASLPPRRFLPIPGWLTGCGSGRQGVMTLNGYLSFRRGMDSERHLSIADDSSCISTMWPVANGQHSVPIIHRLHTEAHGTVTCTRAPIAMAIWLPLIQPMEAMDGRSIC